MANFHLISRKPVRLLMLASIPIDLLYSAAAQPAYESFEGSAWAPNLPVAGIVTDSPGANGWEGAAVIPAGSLGAETVTVGGSVPMRYLSPGMIIEGGTKHIVLAPPASTESTPAAQQVAVAFPMSSARVPSSDFYVSFLLRVRGELAYDQVRIALGSGTKDATNQNPRFGITSGAKPQFFIGSGTENVSFMDVAADVTYFFVLRAVSNGTAWAETQVFVNPRGTNQPEQPTASAKGDSKVSPLRTIVLRANSFEPGDALEIDEIRVGDSWASVIP